MMTAEAFSNLALSLPGTEQTLHFDRVGFKVIGKRMFATYLPKDNTANIFLTTAEQTVFCQMDSESICPVPNKWGKKGATIFALNRVAEELVLEALLSAYNDLIKTK